MNESNFQLVCSFQYTKKSRRGKGVSLSANFSFTFEPCCPQMTVRLAIREISANVAPLVLSETFNETSSTSVSGSDSSSSMKVAVTMNKEKKTIRFMVNCAVIVCKHSIISRLCIIGTNYLDNMSCIHAHTHTHTHTHTDTHAHARTHIQACTHAHTL